MSLSLLQTEPSAEFNYHLLRSALDGFGKNLSQLDDEQYQQVERKASKTYELENLVLATDEAKGVVISTEVLDQALAEVAARYSDHDEFISDLANNGLDEVGLRQALYRELMFNNVMQKIAARAANVNDLDMRLFYELHGDRFSAPEQRTVRHILVTINPDFPENTALAARARIEQVAEKLGDRGNRFHEFAKRYSECPTAMQGGKLGEVPRGQLYPELDAVLFAMAEGEISGIVESEMGLHILWCEKIKPGKKTPYSKAAPRIREYLQERQRRNCQKAWLAELRQSS